MPSPDDVLIATIEPVLTGAGLPEAPALQNGHETGTGFLAAPVAGEATPRASVIWYEDGKPVDGAAGAAGKLRDCERALRRAGFHVEYAAQSTGGCLLARRGTRGR